MSRLVLEDRFKFLLFACVHCLMPYELSRMFCKSVLVGSAVVFHVSSLVRELPCLNCASISPCVSHSISQSFSVPRISFLLRMPDLQSTSCFSKILLVQSFLVCMCGEAGHQARDCPKRGNPLCFNCNQEGHLSRDCTAPPKEKTCYRCNETGHISRDCPNTQSTERFGGASAPSGAECYKCGKFGHIARNCTSNGYGAPTGYQNQSGQTCYSCGGYGHLSRDCTQGQKCYNCGNIGHLSRDCPEAQDRVCYKCKQPGHIMAQCPNEPVAE
ncbi:uncharacterized protein V1516DRAFT_135264 [Lipomyces oligophaga]|uniref:uncharacterized protein n=1 Tax=Lipomyces oligophaga TaxID=45792 RepID=UPI0034CD67C7